MPDPDLWPDGVKPLEMVKPLSLDSDQGWGLSLVALTLEDNLMGYFKV